MFDPLHDYEDLGAAKLRLGSKLQEDCACAACQAADVGHGADGKLLIRETHKIDGRWVVKGRWYHGLELKLELGKRRRMFEDMKQSILGHALVER